ncbi:MAG: AIM24 family protein [Bacilli bacterium]|nr:AIM24 family protein [Bacilli bacterium]
MEYRIKGDNLPVLICKLNKDESLKTESGAMIWMSSNIKMNTVAGNVKKMFGRMITGEAAFQNKYTALEDGAEIAFGSCFPGSIMPFEIDEDHPIIVQKRGFLAGTTGIDLSIFVNKKVGSGLFGGEGFVMQKISGKGLAFVEIDGSACTYDLKEDEKLVVNSGYLAVVSSTCKLDIQLIKGVKNVLFGGEGLFFATVTGPGRVILQTMPISSLADSVYQYLPKEEPKGE